MRRFQDSNPAQNPGISLHLYVGQSVELQIKTNRFLPAIVIGLGGERKEVKDNENGKRRCPHSDVILPPL